MSVADELKKMGMRAEPEMTQSQVWITALKTMGYHFQLNLCDDSIEVNAYGSKLSDVIAARIRTQMRDQGVRKDMRAIEDAYTAEAERNAYHPIKDYFNGLAGKWDGQDRLLELARKIKSDSGCVEYADGRVTPIHAVYIGRWMIGVIAKCLDHIQNPMLTFDGAQGLGKSLLAAYLCPNLEWFVEGPINPQDKDCDVRLMTKLIWEVSELDATTRRADVSALKSFLTKGQVTVRKAYGRNDITKSAMCSFIGTINNTSSGFLADETGSRRFLIVRLTSIDWTYRQIDREQLWAQVYHLYREEGQMPELTAEERAAQERINNEYNMDSPVEDYVRLYFTVTNEPDDTLTMGAILEHLAEKGHRLHGSERLQAMEVARALTLQGVKKIHTRQGNSWAGVAIKR